MFGHEYDWTPHSYRIMLRSLMRTTPWNRGMWQAMDISQSTAHDTHELDDVTVYVGHVPQDVHDIQAIVKPDLPWAEDHFLERVGRVPVNPPPSSSYWPHAVRNNGDHTDDTGQFDHTYPERFWPKHAGGRIVPSFTDPSYQMRGIRFAYGDLQDVVNLLARDPFTRQAYLPVWFPEDTGATAHKGPYDYDRDGDPSPIRVPCTLGYHFMADKMNRINMRYYMRSCDIRRHLTNDVYLACRLLQWVCESVAAIPSSNLTRATAPTPGRMVMHISSLHMFRADQRWAEQQLVVVND